MDNTIIINPQTEASPPLGEVKPPQIEPKKELKIVKIDAATKKQIERYVRLCRREKKIKDAKDKIKNNIIEICNSEPAILHSGQEQLGKLIGKEHTSFDIKGLATVNPELAAQFTKKTPYLELRCA